MNVLKNMEAIFIVAVALAVSASAFAAPVKTHPSAQATPAGKMVQVVVKAKRMSAAQKALLSR